MSTSVWKGQKGLQQLCTSLKTLKSKDELLSEWVTRSPIELSWTAKNTICRPCGWKFPPISSLYLQFLALVIPGFNDLCYPALTFRQKGKNIRVISIAYQYSDFIFRKQKNNNNKNINGHGPTWFSLHTRHTVFNVLLLFDLFLASKKVQASIKFLCRLVEDKFSWLLIFTNIFISSTFLSSHDNNRSRTEALAEHKHSWRPGNR